MSLIYVKLVYIDFKKKEVKIWMNSAEKMHVINYMKQ